MSLIDALDALGIEYREQGGEEVRINCPFCGNENYKLWINKTKKVGQCFRCGQGGTARYILAKFGAVGEIEDRRELKLNLAQVHPQKPSLPTEAITLWNNKEMVLGKMAYDYLIEKRKMLDGEIEQYDIHFCPFGPLAGYIILPIRNINKELTGWQARRYMYSGKKSLNPSGSFGQLYNIDNVNSKAVVLVEGPFDCIAVSRVVGKAGMACVALLGHSLGQTQAAILAYAIKAKTVWVMLDPDVNEDECNVGSLLKEFGIENIKLCQLKECDPDELVEEELLHALERAKNYDDFDDILS